MCKDLPSRHNIKVHIHNKFVDWLKMLKSKLIVSNSIHSSYKLLALTFMHRKPLAEYQ